MESFIKKENLAPAVQEAISLIHDETLESLGLLKDFISGPNNLVLNSGNRESHWGIVISELEKIVEGSLSKEIKLAAKNLLHEIARKIEQRIDVFDDERFEPEQEK